MPTPYEEGFQHGWWTKEEVDRCCGGSVEACLQKAEENYQEEVDKLPTLGSGSAKIHRDYIEGRIAASRESLRAMLQS